MSAHNRHVEIGDRHSHTSGTNALITANVDPGDLVSLPPNRPSLANI